MLLPFLQVEVENEALGDLTLALLALASVILPFNIFVSIMRKWGLDRFGIDKRKFNEALKPIKKLMGVLHVIASLALVAVMLLHTYLAWGSAMNIMLHYAAAIGMVVMLATGILAQFIPMPSKAKKAMWWAHAKPMIFFIVVAIIGLAHLFVGD